MNRGIFVSVEFSGHVHIYGVLKANHGSFIADLCGFMVQLFLSAAVHNSILVTQVNLTFYLVE